MTNNNLAQFLSDEIITPQWEWIEAEIKPGQPAYHYIVNLATKELDDGEEYPVPKDFKSLDVKTVEPGYDAIRELLDNSGYEDWDVMSWRSAPSVEDYEF